jgi:Sec-independent protein translocase protein TatA
VSISISEVFVVLVVAILFIKPENLPDTAFTLGKWLKWLRQATQHVREEIEKPLAKITQEFPTVSPKPLDEKPHE